MDDRPAELEKLKNLIEEADAKYVIKDYDAAAELYAHASELQSELNGEMAVENADLLYSYGRCLYHVAIKNSDVLGTKVAGEAPSAHRKDKKAAKPPATDGDGIIGAAVASAKSDSAPDKGSKEESKPFFQFSGDTGYAESDGDDEEMEEEGGEAGEDAGEVEEDGAAPGEEDDDFTTAYEVLDLARVLQERKLAELEKSDAGSAEERVKKLRELKERLADTYDLVAEISLEAERFSSAVADLRAGQHLKQDLYPPESPFVAEGHFKLSLALEFASMTKDGEDGSSTSNVLKYDHEMREESAKHMELAIKSCELRIREEEQRAEAESDGEMVAEIRRGIEDVWDMVNDMEQRLVELHQPPVSVNQQQSQPTMDGSNPLAGILGQLLGESPEAQKQALEEATKKANDLTGLVKKKKPTAPATTNGTASSSAQLKVPSKRKVGFAEETIEIGTGKKARVEDVNEDTDKSAS